MLLNFTIWVFKTVQLTLGNFRPAKVIGFHDCLSEEGLSGLSEVESTSPTIK